jgi:uncharacterized coiled-coil DUF342 family protein
MDRALKYINLAGVVLLATICVLQWNSNRRLNLTLIQTEKARLEQDAKIADQQKKLQGSQADLDSFREQLIRAHAAVKTNESAMLALRGEVASVKSERDHLRTSLQDWTRAVKERDAQLAKASEQIKKLAEDRDQAVEKYNSLAQTYNQTVQELNSRAQDFNSLVEKYNTLAAGNKPR